MSRNAGKYLKRFDKANAVRRAEGSPPRGEGRMGPGRMAETGARFLGELFNPVKAGEDVQNVGRSYLDMLSAYNELLYQRSPEEQMAFLQSLPSKTREALGSAATALRDLPQTAKRAVEEATPESTAAAVRRFGVESVMDPTRLVKSTGPVTSQIVRPRGEGIVLDNPNAEAIPLYKSNIAPPHAPKGYIPRAIAEGQERLTKRYSELPDENRAAIHKFLLTKVRNYYANQYGTQDDPIYKAIREGRLTSQELNVPGGIRKYLTDAAKEGKTRVNPETGETRFYPSPNAQDAIQDINALYDTMTGMRGAVFARETIGDPKYSSMLSDQAQEELERLKDVTKDRLLNERLRPEEINPRIDYMGYKNPSFVKPDNSLRESIISDRKMETDDIQALFLTNPNSLPKELRTAIEKKQPIYDIYPIGALKDVLDEKSLVDYLATLPVNQINNMRYEDAIRGSVKLQGLRKERNTLLSRIRDNKPVDGKPFLEGVSAPLVSYPEGSPLQGYTWRRLERPDSTELEGAYLGHSVGGYADNGNYTSADKKAFRAGTIKVYSLRDPRGLPVTTVEVKEIPNLGSAVTQVKGAGRATGNTPLRNLNDKELALATNYMDPALVDLFKKLNVTGIQESDSYLPPMALEYKKAARTKPVSSLRARMGAPRPIGGPELPEQAPQPPVQQGIGQLPQAPQEIPNAENFARGMNDQQLIEFVRRLFRDQD